MAKDMKGESENKKLTMHLWEYSPLMEIKDYQLKQ